MYIRLQEKPFYFLTDRETRYTFFVDNQKGASSKHLYYPEKYEHLTAKGVRSYKDSLITKLLRWSVRNSNKMTTTDKNICYSKLFDLGVVILGGLMLAGLFRRFLFKI